MKYPSSAHPLFERPMEIELIRSMVRGTPPPRQNNTMRQPELSDLPSTDAFIIKRADDWLDLPVGEMTGDMLFGEFWFKGEFCILFADTNAGKSILAVQIGEAVSRGEPIGNLSVQRQPDPVLYFDFELSAGQFRKRYTADDGTPYTFAPNFYRVIINPDAGRERKFASYHDYIINALENILVSTKARTVIIDNITCLRSSTQHAAAAVNLMSSLQALKNRYELSLLVLAHTPKRNATRPITMNDLQGSKMLMNFADSAFAIGESQTKPGLRYLKQIKQRSSALVFGAGNVKFCRIMKPHHFLMFGFEGEGCESPHLQPYTAQLRNTMDERIIKLHERGHSIRQIAKETASSTTNVFRTIKRLEKVGGTING